MSKPETTITDLSYLREFSRGNVARMRKYIDLFLQQTPEAVAQLRQHAAAADWEGVRATAHAMKPQLAYMGSKALEHMAKTVQQEAGSPEDTEQLGALVEEFSVCCEQACHELESRLLELKDKH